MHATPATVLHGLVRDLLSRYQALRAGGHPALQNRESVDARVTALLLGEALLRATAGSRHDGWPLQLAVIGPTQTGKSTVVNLLAQRAVAEVSPLAGYTVHPQGFWLLGGDEQKRPADTEPADTLFDMAARDQTHSPAGYDLRWAGDVFPDWHRYEVNALSRDELEAYALSTIGRSAQTDGETALPPCVIWDTPDFDSLASSGYRQGLLATIAAADAYLLVVSKEKYADLSVWRMLELLAPLARPFVICINKLTPDAQAAIDIALQQRLTEHGLDGAKTPRIVVPYEREPAAQGDAARALRAGAADALDRADRTAHAATVRAFARQHWDDWLAPVITEHETLAAWNELAAEALAGLLAAYQRDYLEHPKRYDGFRRATGELLTLLEIPGIGGALSQVRLAVTWPARQLWRVGSELFERTPARAGRGLTGEQVFLYEEVDTLLTRLQTELSRRAAEGKSDAVVWAAIGRRLARETARLRECFQSAAQAHDEQTRKAILEAAGQLYEALKERPKLLNSLRAARVTADAGSIALAIKTGGASMHDLVLAPALFGVMSLLTEGALGTYMRRIAAELKQKQYEITRSELVHGLVQRELVALATHLDDDLLFGISPERISAARQALDSWE